MWDPKENPEKFCPRGGAGFYEPECCTNEKGTSPYILFNTYNKKCCPDGSVLPDGEPCGEDKVLKRTYA